MVGNQYQRYIKIINPWRKGLFSFSSNLFPLCNSIMNCIIKYTGALFRKQVNSNDNNQYKSKCSELSAINLFSQKVIESEE